jgi:hypothetical protein
MRKIENSTPIRTDAAGEIARLKQQPEPAANTRGRHGPRAVAATEPAAKSKKERRLVMTSSPSITPRPAATAGGPDHYPAWAGTATTRRLLACGAVAGPVFVAAVVVQALTRPGFSLTRDAASLLDLGSLGWVQVTTFIVTGLLLIAAAAGIRRSIRRGPGHRWIPRMLIVIGAGLTGGGVFRPDASGGYPPGTPAGASAVSSWHGVLHEVCGSAAFLALVVACVMLARRYRATRQRGMAAGSLAAGVLCAAGVASGGAPHGSLTLFAGVSIAPLWTAVVSARLISTAGRP